MNNNIKITSFHVMGSRVDFTVNGCQYHTDRNGEGLWKGETYEKQVEGTLDFALKQKTRNGVTKALERYFA